MIYFEPHCISHIHKQKQKGEQPHFKAAHTMNETLFVCSNTFTQQDMLGTETGGRFAQWQGDTKNSSNNYGWEIIEETGFVEVTGRHKLCAVLFLVVVRIDIWVMNV